MSRFNHFSLSDRYFIEHSLNDSLSFKAIGRALDKDCSSVSKEIKIHLVFKQTGGFGKPFNNCFLKYDCTQSKICPNESCNQRYCKNCGSCFKFCPDYHKEFCSSLAKPPYVCNGCSKKSRCSFEKAFYSASYAQKEYELCRSESRCGINITEDELKALDSFVTPLLLKGQSIHHICSNNSDVTMCSEKTIYNYIDSGLLSVGNIDLPRKVRFRPRRKSKAVFKVDKRCRIGRTYEDFLSYMLEHPDTPVVEMDSVEGSKGGKVLLTVHFTDTQFMLAFLRDANTSRSVTDIFGQLYEILGQEAFSKLFPLILTDNGSEFSNPEAIEFDCNDLRRTAVFYCDPSAPYQKGAAENNHSLIRRVIPKGCSFNSYTQEDINKMMNHINSYGRKKLSDISPYVAFSFFHGSQILEKLGAEFIPANDVILHPSLFKK
ncbi:MAG: IS30 family transposase [Clostridiaceae bacterium]|nr:IS30 family transposase [Clostridiaceae bacterium]